VFARKNYFYPDLPERATRSRNSSAARDRRVPVRTCRRTAGLPPLTIQRLHVEEDAGKSLHDRFPKQTAIDLNRLRRAADRDRHRSGFPVAHEARAYLCTLKAGARVRGDLRTADMEKGACAWTRNVSVRRAGETALGTKTEVKNINSFAYVEKALTVERDRQIAVLEGGGTVAPQTMLYDSKTNSVRPQRSKEESHDYRYFPDPDLPPLVLTRSSSRAADAPAGAAREKARAFVEK